ncbi:MAG: tRNA pseudouridine(13) synthase TruD [Idiomarina sp.]|nr:MAG: tRNA pseudouridine(13) synthase TruD [Idiomarina sp.]
MSVTDAYLHGIPTCRGTFKASPEDFQVTEVLALPVTEPSEQVGEHQWLWVKKKGANTAFVAGQLAKFAGVKERDVSFSGLKDRHAVTYQWFSVQLPGQALLPWETLEHPEFSVEKAALQPKKLKTGTHRANHFVLKIRDIDQTEQFRQRWQQIVEQGVPNYFGEQRFGHNGQNIEQAKRWFSGQLKRRLTRNQIGLYLSAARSFLFNQVVSERISTQRLMPEIGDAVMLQGSQSFFVVDTLDASLFERYSQGDIMLTAPLPGSDKWASSASLAEFEQSICRRYPELMDGLAKQRVDHARRPLLMTLQNPQLRWLADDCAELEFSLPRGSFATSVLRELICDSMSTPNSALISEPTQGN